MFSNYNVKKVDNLKLNKNIEKRNILKKENNVKYNDTYEEINYDEKKNVLETNNAKSILKSWGTLSSYAFNEKLKTYKPYSKGYHDTYLEYRISQVGGYGTRDAAVAAAKYLSEEYTIDGKNLPYFWGGKKLSKGVDESWGSLKPITGSGTSSQPLGQLFPYGLDCSGFISWTLYNSGYDINVYYSDGIVDYCKQRGGVDHRLGPNVFDDVSIKPGDIIYRDKGNDDHIAIITGYDPNNKIIKFAEEKGGKGLIVNEISFDEFINMYIYSDKGFTGIISMDKFYSNEANLINN